VYSDSGAFVLKARTVRVDCDVTEAGSEELAYPGLWAEVRRNLTNGERMELRERADDIDARADRITTEHTERHAAYVAALETAAENPEDQNRLINERVAEINEFVRQTEQVTVERFELIAPHVHRWNLNTINDDGDMAPVPSPREGGAAVMAEIDTPLVGWLLQTTLQAYRLGFPVGSRPSGAQREPTPEPSAEKPKGSGSRSRRSPAKSPSPEA